MPVSPHTSAAPPTAAPLFVEDAALLIALGPRAGRRAAEHRAVLGAAAAVDLAERDLVQARPGIFSTYLLAAGAEAPDDQLLRPAWEHMSEGFVSTRAAFPAIGGMLAGPLIARLRAAGDVRAASAPAFGVRRRPALVAASDRHRLLRERVRAALAGASDPHALVLGALLTARGGAHALELTRAQRADARERTRRLLAGDAPAGITETGALMVRSLADRHARSEDPRPAQTVLSGR